jgi:hypothetical protein
MTCWIVFNDVAVCQNLVPLVNIKIAGKWMFIPLKMVLIGIDPYPCLSVQQFEERPHRPIELYRTTILRLGNWQKDTSNTFKCQLSGLWNFFPIFLLFLFLRIPFIWILTSRSILKLAWRPLKTSAEATGWLANWLGFWLQTQLSLPSPQLSRGKRNWYTQRIKKCRMI